MGRCIPNPGRCRLQPSGLKPEEELEQESHDGTGSFSFAFQVPFWFPPMLGDGCPVGLPQGLAICFLARGLARTGHSGSAMPTRQGASHRRGTGTMPETMTRM